MNNKFEKWCRENTEKYDNDHDMALDAWATCKKEILELLKKNIEIIEVVDDANDEKIIEYIDSDIINKIAKEW